MEGSRATFGWAIVFPASPHFNSRAAPAAMAATYVIAACERTGANRFRRMMHRFVEKVNPATHEKRS
jgi:hypothetical protein